MSQVKIVATIGPGTNSPETLRALQQAGMGIARLNGSHADLDWHAKTIESIRKAVPDVPVLFDIPGRKIRLGRLDEDLKIESGHMVTLTTEPGNRGLPRVSINHDSLHEFAAPGGVILADQGAIRLTIMEVNSRELTCRAETPGTLRSMQGIHFPGLNLNEAFLSPVDRKLIDFSCKQGTGFIGLSFVENAGQIKEVRSLIGSQRPAIVSKVETQGALNSLGDVLQASDAVMIDRGDLSMETNHETVGLAQKRVLHEARLVACPVIVATEMLKSMISSPVPTQAEVSDITNAVLDGATALMLSDETAVGRYPIETVTLMRRVADSASNHLIESLDDGGKPGEDSVPRAIGEAIALISRRLPVTKIVAITVSGFAARMVAATMPRQTILAVSNDPEAARNFNLLRGTIGVYVDIPFSRTTMEHIPGCLEELWRMGHIVDEDLILITALSYPKSGNRMNLIETHKISDLRDSLGWSR